MLPLPPVNAKASGLSSLKPSHSCFVHSGKSWSSSYTQGILHWWTVPKPLTWHRSPSVKCTPLQMVSNTLWDHSTHFLLKIKPNRVGCSNYLAVRNHEGVRYQLRNRTMELAGSWSECISMPITKLQMGGVSPCGAYRFFLSVSLKIQNWTDEYFKFFTFIQVNNSNVKFSLCILECYICFSFQIV